LGIPIAAVTLEAALDHIDAAIAARSALHIGVVNAAKIVNMSRDAQLRDSVVASDVVFADGMSVVWASRVLGRPLPERVAGIDLMTGMLARGNRRGYRVYCLGATDEVLDRTIARIATDYPGVRVVGKRNGYFEPDQEAAVAADIAASKADILLVAITSPKKERFMEQWANRLGVPICHGVGGSFDVMAGKVERAPVMWQKLGLEWLYRVKQEPGRLWKRYLTTNAMFTLMVVRDACRRRPGAAHVPGAAQAAATTVAHASGARRR
jgi:N-acetylglucosaminyldiphosphoundecaprenol N-acetyl-beta-D-mannosaminyltransferase